MALHGSIPGERFCTGFVCMDGRCVEAVHFWCQRRLYCHLDTITGPALVKILADGRDVYEIRRARSWATDVSHGMHGSTTAIVAGHSDCAGHDVCDDDHIATVYAAAEAVFTWGPFSDVYPLFVAPHHGVWVAQLLPNRVIDGKPLYTPTPSTVVTVG